MKKLLFFLLICAGSAQAQLEGLWHSSFQVAGKSLLMDLDIKGIGRDGSISVTIPDQPQIKPQEMANYSLFIDSLDFRWDRIGLSFAGKLKNDSLKGIMKQSGLEWNVVFTKTVRATRRKISRAFTPLTSDFAKSIKSRCYFGFLANYCMAGAVMPHEDSS